MPVYEYLCLNCQKRFEIYASIKEYESLKPFCPKCRSQKVRRVFGRINIKTESKTEEGFEDFGDLEGFGE